MPLGGSTTGRTHPTILCSPYGASPWERHLSTPWIDWQERVLENARKKRGRSSKKLTANQPLHVTGQLSLHGHAQSSGPHVNWVVRKLWAWEARPGRRYSWSMLPRRGSA